MRSTCSSSAAPRSSRTAVKDRFPASLGPTAVTLTAAPPANTLRALADRTGFLIGNVMRDLRDRTNEPVNQVLAREFNYVTLFPNMQN